MDSSFMEATITRLNLDLGLDLDRFCLSAVSSKAVQVQVQVELQVRSICCHIELSFLSEKADVETRGL